VPKGRVVEHLEPLRLLAGPGAGPEPEVRPDLSRRARRREHDGLGVEVPADEEDDVHPIESCGQRGMAVTLTIDSLVMNNHLEDKRDMVKKWCVADTAACSKRIRPLPRAEGKEVAASM
jgi:hypothetical protein